MSDILCPLCAQRPATVHLSEVQANGVIASLHCCHHCVQRLDLNIRDDPTPIEEVHRRNKQSQGSSTQPIAASETAPATTEPCPVCGLSWSDFLSRNRFGCAHDLEHFGPALATALLALHGHEQHVGRGPGDASPDYDKLLGQRRRLLQQALDDAIASEAFERAAELRDALRGLENDPDKQESQQ